MKRILLFTGVLLSAISLFAQQLDGTYRNGEDSIVFSNNRAIFRVSGFGGLSSAHVGEGSYELIDEFLLIHTSDYSGDKTSFKPSNGSKTDTCVVKTISMQNYSIQGILVEARNNSGKLVSSKVTDNDGTVCFSPCQKIAFISASSLGYSPITFNYTPANDYTVILAAHDVIENKTVVFRTLSIDEETISLLMLTDDLNAGKNRDGELNKLMKKAQKSNRLDIRFKKVYVPYLRKYPAAGE